MRRFLMGVTSALVAAAATAVPAQPAAAAGEYIKIRTASAVGYGAPYTNLDGSLMDFVFRPRLTVRVELRCPAGSEAAVGFDPVTAHQLPGTPRFDCTGSAQEITINPASSGEAGTVKVSTELYVDGSATGSTDVRNVKVTDVRTSWARLTAPDEVTRNRPMELASTIQLFTKGDWAPLGTRVAVQFGTGGSWSTVGETITGKNGRLRFKTAPLTRSGDWRLTWNHGGRRWYSDTAAVEVKQPPALPVAPAFWAGKVTRTTADMHWTAPKGATGITGYRFGWTSSNGKPVKAWQDDWPATARSPLTMVNLHPGTTYTMWVRAITAHGLGKKATVKVRTQAPAAVAPTAPRNVRATPGARQIVVRWAAPAKNGGAAVNRYQVRLTSAGVKQAHTVAPTRRSLTVKGLKKGKAYAVTTRARNAAGWSSWSRALTVRVR